MDILKTLEKQLNISLEFSDDLAKAHLVSKDAFKLAGERGKKTIDVANEIVSNLNFDNKVISKIEVASPGFINIFLTDEFLLEGARCPQGAPGSLHRKKIMVEYTDPNPFKVFHIGHFMPNLVGQALTNVFEYLGAKVKRANYQGDVGMHVAKSIYGVLELGGLSQVQDKSLQEKTEFLGKSYVIGTNAYESDANAKTKIQAINKAVYKIAQDELLASEFKEDLVDYGELDSSLNLNQIKDIYLTGRKWSLEKFEEIYKRLDTKFDNYYFESTAGEVGVKLVKEGLENRVFEESDGAVVFKGEKYKLHTRVFINSQGLPTYEAKDLGLAGLKQNDFDYDLSFIITGNEVNEYFQVVIKALSLIDPSLGSKTKHVSHGMLKLTTGKMSSRKGNIVNGEELMDMGVSKVYEIIKDRKDLSKEEKAGVAEVVGLGAIKYMILRPKVGVSIAFDIDESVKYEGNSGPYLQYTTVRANSILSKIQREPGSPRGSLAPSGVEKEPGSALGQNLVLSELERELLLKFMQFNNVVLKCADSYSLHYLSNYLFDLAQSFNSYYATTKIDEGKDTKEYRVNIVKNFTKTMTTGLGLLGIKVPEKM